MARNSHSAGDWVEKSGPWTMWVSVKVLHCANPSGVVGITLGLVSVALGSIPGIITYLCDFFQIPW
eukprot:scaffold267080_cov40-Attheya_sp.AAC.3